MTSASFSFVLLASIIGMGIVFVFLIMLSLLMVMIRGLDRVAEGGEGGDATDAAAEPRTAQTGAGSRAGAPAARPGTLREARGVSGLPVWAVAAVTRYLAHEAELDAERMRSSASVWTSRAVR